MVYGKSSPRNLLIFHPIRWSFYLFLFPSCSSCFCKQNPFSPWYFQSSKVFPHCFFWYVASPLRSPITSCVDFRHLRGRPTCQLDLMVSNFCWISGKFWETLTKATYCGKKNGSRVRKFWQCRKQNMHEKINNVKSPATYIRCKNPPALENTLRPESDVAKCTWRSIYTQPYMKNIRSRLAGNNVNHLFGRDLSGLVAIGNHFWYWTLTTCIRVWIIYPTSGATWPGSKGNGNKLSIHGAYGMIDWVTDVAQCR